MLLQLSHFPPLSPPPPCNPPPTNIPPTPLFMSMGRTYKVFRFSISYTILNLPLSILCLPFMLFTPCTFSPILSPPSPSPLITLQVISIYVILFLFQLFAQFIFVFVVFLRSVVNSCEFFSLYCSQFSSSSFSKSFSYVI